MVETVEIGVGLVAYFTDRYPNYTIAVDNQVLFDSNQSETKSNLANYQFNLKLQDGPHQLRIRFNETPGCQTGVDIVSLRFNQQVFNETDIYLRGKFQLDQSRNIDGVLTNSITQYKHLGWSGTWSFDFEIPWIIWALRCL